MDLTLSLQTGAGRGAGSLLSHFRGFESSLAQEFELFQEFIVWGKFCEIRKIPELRVPRSLLGDQL